MSTCIFRMSPQWIVASCMLPLMPSSATAGGTGDPKFEDPSFVPPPPQEIRASPQGAFRILFVGNSITRHGIAIDNLFNGLPLKWDHVAGMAASNEANDFAHRLGARIQKTMPNRKVELLFGNTNECRANRQAISYGNRPPPDLVIIQTGEHEGPGKSKGEVAEIYETSLIKPFHDLSPQTPIICVGIWYPSDGEPYAGWVRDINDAYREVCAKYRIPFVSVESVAKDPSCRGWGENPGVKWHPNDKGMEGYARLLFEAYRHNMGSVAAGNELKPRN